MAATLKRIGPTEVLTTRLAQIALVSALRAVPHNPPAVVVRTRDGVFLNLLEGGHREIIPQSMGSVSASLITISCGTVAPSSPLANTFGVNREVCSRLLGDTPRVKACGELEHLSPQGGTLRFVGAILLLLFLGAIAREAGLKEAFLWFLLIMVVYTVVLSIKWLWRLWRGTEREDDIDIGDLRDIVEE